MASHKQQLCACFLVLCLLSGTAMGAAERSMRGSRQLRQADASDIPTETGAGSTDASGTGTSATTAEPSEQGGTGTDIPQATDQTEQGTTGNVGDNAPLVTDPVDTGAGTANDTSSTTTDEIPTETAPADNTGSTGTNTSTSAPSGGETAPELDTQVDNALSSGDASALQEAAQTAESTGNEEALQTAVSDNLASSGSSENALSAIESAPQDGSYTSQFGIQASEVPTSGAATNTDVNAKLAALAQAADSGSAIPSSGRKLLQASFFLYRIFASAQAEAICSNPNSQGGNLLRGVTSSNTAFATATARGIQFAAQSCCTQTTRAVYQALLEALNNGRAEFFVARMDYFKPRLGINSCGW